MNTKLMEAGNALALAGRDDRADAALAAIRMAIEAYAMMVLPAEYAGLTLDTPLSVFVARGMLHPRIERLGNLDPREGLNIKMDTPLRALAWASRRRLMRCKNISGATLVPMERLLVTLGAGLVE